MKSASRFSGMLFAAIAAFITSGSDAFAQAQSLFGQQGPVSSRSNSLLGSSTGRGATGGSSGSLTSGGSLTGTTPGSRLPQRGNFGWKWSKANLPVAISVTANLAVTMGKTEATGRPVPDVVTILTQVRPEIILTFNRDAETKTDAIANYATSARNNR